MDDDENEVGDISDIYVGPRRYRMKKKMKIGFRSGEEQPAEKKRGEGAVMQRRTKKPAVKKMAHRCK